MPSTFKICPIDRSMPREAMAADQEERVKVVEVIDGTGRKG